MNRYFDALEPMPVAERQAQQDWKLCRMLTDGYEKSPQVRRMMEALKLTPEDILSCGDLEALPVITREKLVEMELADPPYGGLADPEGEVDRIFTSPGPVYEPHLSEADPLWARAYFAAGIGKGDIVLNAFSYHMVAAGLTFHNGLRKVGATVIPSGTSGAQVQVQLLKDLKATAFTGTPSFLLSILKKAEEMGLNVGEDICLRKGCFAAEPLPPSLRRVFEEEYRIDTYGMYGATEVGDIAYECREKRGWHLCEEVFVEIVDPATGKRVPPGHLGEVVVTRFNNLFFLFRFGTGDLSRLIDEPCACGRTSRRLDGILGRVGEAVKVRGLFVAPSQLRQVAERFSGVRVQAVVGRRDHEDRLHLKVSVEAGCETPSNLGDAVAGAFREVCTVRVDTVEVLAGEGLTADAPLLKDERDWT